MANFFQTLETVLKKDERFFSKDAKTLLRNKIYESAVNMDSALIKLLLSNNETKERFFTDIDGVLVFDKTAFGWAVNNHQFLPDSYTRFKNRIGLSDSNGELLSASNDVVLSFPYKDCILEGGQTKEDQKRDEVFYNSILAPDDVDRLLYPKVFTGAKRYTANGIEESVTFKDGDNLIIKGNNLLAISSLLKRFEGKVKLIYIDPPYNTGKDDFSYNDKFNRSAWLTFVKNRLEIARKLLSSDGAIYVQLDYHQVHYAKVLMDEIFKEENFQREIIWRIGWLSGYKTIEKNYIRNHDTILFYSKDNNKLNFQKKYLLNSEFKKPIKDVKKFVNNAISLGVKKDTAEKIAAEVNEMPQQYPIEDVWNGNEYDDLNSIAIVSFAGETVSKMLEPNDEVKGQKSEKLLERIIQAHTEIGDLVLDFFGGTGTTAAAAHKMGRQYITCEQLDKHIDIAIRRLKKVIEGEQSGISKRQNWKGGGSFIYCELAKCNQHFVDMANAAKTDKEAIALLDEVLVTGFISHKVFPADISGAADEFALLSLDDKKRFILELLDKNMLYVNLCDINDKDCDISKADKTFTNSFYKTEDK